MGHGRHRLLLRQLARHFPDGPGPELAPFLADVERAYAQADADRVLLERSLDMTSTELLERNARLTEALVTERARQTIATRYREALAQLAVLMTEDLDRSTCLGVICTAVADVMGVEAVSVWSLDGGADRPRCESDYRRTPGAIADRAEIGPAGLSHLGNRRVVAVDDLDEYDLANAITAVLTAPCRIAGKVVGLVRLGATGGPRSWSDDDRQFAASVADCVSLVLETDRRRRAEESRAQLEADLRQSQRLESIGMLAGGVAHDFNNLLVPILGNAGVLQDAVDPADPDHELIEEIFVAADAARELVAQLLAFSRKQVLQLRVVDVNKEVRKLSRLLARTLPASMRLELDLDDGVLGVVADAGQLQQVLLNLVVNARDAMAHGGTVRITTRTATADGLPWAVIAVEDTGCGMDAQTLAKVFEPFFTTKALGRGTGLGLSTVYGIVEQHHGRVVVTSEPGVGSRFEVRIPRSDAPVTHVTKPLATTLRGTETILIVEDDPMVLGVSRRLLGGFGYHVLAAENPAQAIALAREHPELSLVVADVMMPTMNGKAVFDRIVEDGSQAGVLYMSGYDSDILAPQGSLAGDVALLRKPFSAQDLGRAVREAIEGNLQRKRGEQRRPRRLSRV